MKLRIKNVAKIKSAELTLNGITVIAGNNNTGKSTVGKVIFAIFNSMVNIDQRIDKQKQDLIYAMLLRKTEGTFVQDGVEYSASRVPLSRLNRMARELLIQNEEQDEKGIIRNILSRINDDIGEREQDIWEEVQKIKQLPRERLIKSAVTTYFDAIFYSEINNKNHKDEDALLEAEIRNKNIRMIFRDNICQELDQQIAIRNNAVYLDNPFILDFLNDGAFNLNPIERIVVSKLRKIPDEVEDVVQINLMEERLKDVMQCINKVSAGVMQQDEAKTFCYKDDTIGEPLSVNNLSTGLKSFLIIKTLLKNGALKEKDVLILDEPEIHLHPEWQMIYAEIIVLLQKTFDLTIILTTHSPHFLEALQFFAQKYKIDDKCNYYLSKETENDCEIEDASCDIRKIYKQMVEPSIYLDKLKFKLEETEDE